jgi:hypothetical protein
VDNTGALWAGVSITCGIVVMVKLIMLRRRPEVWWITNLIAFLAIGVGSAFMINESAVNDFLGTPNVAQLLFNVCVAIAAGAVSIYSYTLRVAQPTAQRITQHAGICLAVCVAIVVAWAAAPLHDLSYPHAREIPVTGAVMTYDWIYHIYIAGVVANMTICVFATVPLTAHGDPARWAGYEIGVAQVIIVSGQLLYMARLAVQPIVGAEALVLAAAADVAILIGMLGVAAGSITMSVGPHVLQHVRARRLVGDLRPLWSQLRALHPEVQVSSGILRGSPALRAERMLIEIGDALSILQVTRPRDAGTDRMTIVVDALRETGLPHDTECVTAAALLPQPTTRAEEEDQARELARRLQRV